MSYSKRSKEFVSALMEEFQTDEVGQIFLCAAIISGAEDFAKRNPDHIYQGFIRGKEWIATARKILEKRDELYAEGVKKAALATTDQRSE